MRLKFIALSAISILSLSLFTSAYAQVSKNFFSFSGINANTVSCQYEISQQQGYYQAELYNSNKEQAKELPVFAASGILFYGAAPQENHSVTNWSQFPLDSDREGQGYFTFKEPKKANSSDDYLLEFDIPNTVKFTITKCSYSNN